MILKILWGIIAFYSIAELIYVWVEWYKYLHVARKENTLSAGGIFKNYFKLAGKALIPGILGIIGVLCAFLA